MSQTIIEAKNISYSIDNQSILKEITFKVQKGSYLGIIGPNGGGKTTLLKILLGLLKPTAGEVFLFGKKIRDFSRWDKIGYVPQRATLIDPSFPATVREIVELGRIAHRGFFKRTSKEDKKAVREAMEILDIGTFENRLIGELSGGQRQRVMIARAIASKPEVLILDEPTTGVDVASQGLFYDFLRRLNREHKMTILFVTHDIGVIAQDITSVLCINQSVAFSGPMSEILSCDKMSAAYGIKAHIISQKLGRGCDHA